jgi:hypothetical protein
MTPGVALRAVGVRLPYNAVPTAVQTWVEEACGASVVDAVTQPGGMSPGCAVRLRLANGGRAFVKAVGPELNPQTPELFRVETDVLSRLPAVPWRPKLQASYDDGAWVALLLEDIDGRHPDWTDPADIARVLAAVQRQSAELTPPPPGIDVRSAAEQALRWTTTLQSATDAELAALPDWLDLGAPPITSLIARLPGGLRGETLCHWDVRNDNVLIRPDHTVVFVDWGTARRGPGWADAAIFALEWADTSRFEEILDAVEDSRRLDAEALTAFLLLLGAHLTIMGTRPAPPGLPTMPAFRSREGARFLTGARRRLAAG